MSRPGSSSETALHQAVVQVRTELEVRMPGVTGRLRAHFERPATRRGDLVAVGIGLGLFALAAVSGGLLYLAGHPVHAGSAPLYAHWLPHLGPGTPLALLVAGLVWRFGPSLAARLRWAALHALAYATAVAWTLSLALIDGWQRGVAGRLTTRPEYLHEVPGVTDVPAMLRGFTARILDFQPDSWTTHVAGHPPGALLVFVGLDRLGLHGGGWAGLLCILAGALVAVTVPQTVRLIGGDTMARACVPFLVLFPGAVWVGVSADGLFAGVTSAGVMLLATSGWSRPLAGGILLGFGCYLSYGLLLMAAPALAVVLVRRSRTALFAGLLGAGVVATVFTASGFDWLTGYHLVQLRYYQGLAARRPYLYWVWADLAILVVSAGPAAVAALPRTVKQARPGAARWLPLAALVAIFAADLSGFSKAEVERIWLPFGVWLLAGTGLLPAGDRRWWLLAQAATALTVNHLLLTTW
jgi:methylthioxylose transferase